MQLMSDALDKFLPSFLEAQKKMGNAQKDSSNPFFKSSYADLNSVREATIPVLNSVGIVVLQPTVVLDGRNYVKTILLHETGQFIASLTEVKVKEANNPQAEGSGISYARRYGLQSITGIGAQDDDGESSMGRPKPSVSTTNSAPKKSSFKDSTPAKETINERPEPEWS